MKLPKPDLDRVDQDEITQISIAVHKVMLQFLKPESGSTDGCPVPDSFFVLSNQISLAYHRGKERGLAIAALAKRRPRWKRNALPGL